MDDVVGEKRAGLMAFARPRAWAFACSLLVLALSIACDKDRVTRAHHAEGASRPPLRDLRGERVAESRSRRGPISTPGSPSLIERSDIAELLKGAPVVIVARFGTCVADQLSVEVLDVLKRTDAQLDRAINVAFPCTGAMLLPPAHGRPHALDFREGAYAVAFLAQPAKGRLPLLRSAVRLESLEDVDPTFLREVVIALAYPSAEKRAAAYGRWLTSADPSRVAIGLSALHEETIDPVSSEFHALLDEVIAVVDDPFSAGIRRRALSTTVRLGGLGTVGTTEYDRLVRTVVGLVGDAQLSGDALRYLVMVRNRLDPDAGGFNIDGTSPRQQFPHCAHESPYRRHRCEQEWQRNNRLRLAEVWRSWFEGGGHNDERYHPMWDLELPRSPSKVDRLAELTERYRRLAECARKHGETAEGSVHYEADPWGTVTVSRLRNHHESPISAELEACVLSAFESVCAGRSRSGIRFGSAMFNVPSPAPQWVGVDNPLTGRLPPCGEPVRIPADMSLPW
jgi:hypothetical protein